MQKGRRKRTRLTIPELLLVFQAVGDLKLHFPRLEISIFFAGPWYKIPCPFRGIWRRWEKNGEWNVRLVRWKKPNQDNP